MACALPLCIMAVKEPGKGSALGTGMGMGMGMGIIIINTARHTTYHGCSIVHRVDRRVVGVRAWSEAARIGELGIVPFPHARSTSGQHACNIVCCDASACGQP